MKPKGNTRVTGNEQFYTPIEVARGILDTARELIPDLENRGLLEPAAGTGNFIKAAHDAGSPYALSFDLFPTLHETVPRDFLTADLGSHEGLITISNPPFGRNNSLSIPFFNKAAEVSEWIIFIVPRSWRKWSVQNRLNQNFHLVRDDDLDIVYEDELGHPIVKKNQLRTCVQFWERKAPKRPLIAIEDLGLIHRCTPEDADVALTVFGYGCGTVRTDFPRVKNTTQMFLKLKDPRALEALQNVDFSRFYLRTAYVPSLSFSEINCLLNEYMLDICTKIT